MARNGGLQLELLTRKVQEFISRYGLAAHLALLAVAPLFLFHSCGAATIGVVLLWLSLAGAMWLFLEPSRREGELLHDARRRTARAISSDPVLWLFALLAGFAAIRWLNSAPGLVYDAENSVWSMAKPPVGWLPSSCGDAGFLPFCSVVAVGVAAVGCRNAMGRSARMGFLAFTSVFAAIAAVAAIALLRPGGSAGAASLAQAGVGAAEPCGDAFGLYMLAGATAIAGAFDCKWNGLMLFLALAAGANGAALYCYAPPAHAAVFAAAVLFVHVVASVHVWLGHSMSTFFKFQAAIVMAAVCGVTFCIWLAPQELVKAKAAAFASLAFFPDGFAALRGRLSEIARDAWKGGMWLGTGEGSFPLDVRLAATPEDWAAWGATPPKSAANGWFQLVAERGIAGAAAIALPVFFMLATFVRRAFSSGGWKRPFLPFAALALAAVFSLAAIGFADNPLASPAVLAPLACSFALAPFIFAKRGRTEEEEDFEE